MELKDIEKITVIGAGSMGHGIAEIIAMAGYEVNLVDLSEEILKNALWRIEKSLELLSEGGSVGKGEIGSILQRIHPFLSLEDATRDVDFALEAVTERIELKKKIFGKLDELLPPDVLLATNTSSVSVSELARSTRRPGRVVGTHFVHAPQRIEGFMGPHLSIMLPLVEVVKTKYADEETIELVLALMKRIGKHPEVVKDTPAFVANRFIIRAGIEAGYSLGEADVREIDAAAVYGLGFPLGIFLLLDVIGLDVGVYILDYLRGVLGEEYQAPEPLRMMVEQGNLGQKSGRGFYDYSRGPPEIRREDWKTFDPLRILAPMVNEAAKLIEDDVADAAQIERILQLSFIPGGFFTRVDEVGLNTIVEKLEDLKKEHGMDWYEPRGFLKEMLREGKRFADILGNVWI